MTEQVSPTEVWKAIPGYEGFYSVSDLGRVRRDLASKGTRGGVLKPGLTTWGYPGVMLRGADFKPHPKKVHRLVLEAFRGLDPLKPEANHINGIKTDARLVNLEWCTRKENAHHNYHVLGQSNLGRGETHHRSVLTNEQARDIRRLGSQGMKGIEIARLYGTNKYVVSDCLRRKTYSHV